MMEVKGTGGGAEDGGAGGAQVRRGGAGGRDMGGGGGRQGRSAAGGEDSARGHMTVRRTPRAVQGRGDRAGKTAEGLKDN